VDEPIGLFRTFARNPAMWTAMEGWGRYELGRDLSIDRRTREVAILRTCARCRCAYEWGVHVSYFAERVGLTEADVAATWAAPADDPAQPDGLVAELVDELHDTAAVSDALWSRLQERFSDEQLLDLLLLVGWYHAISFAANGAGVEPEPWAAAPPDDLT
jgi:alkylhydroperoxidase family enzyme